MFSGGAFLKRASGALALVFFWSGLQAQIRHEVVVENYAFSPAHVTIKAGDTVVWINKEKRTSHSVLFARENGLESDRLFPGESWSRTFSIPGEYPYTCGPHPEMKGSVLVVQ